MATYLLDTTVIIDAINEKKNRNAILIGLVEQGHILACCPINVAEVYAGLRPKEEQKTAGLLRSLQLYPITFPVAELAGRLKRNYGHKGKTLTIPDAIIAAVALHYQLILITDNPKDFPMPALSFHRLPDYQ
jgi:predicted nucleic acid-binding protein